MKVIYFIFAAIIWGGLGWLCIDRPVDHSQYNELLYLQFEYEKLVEKEKLDKTAQTELIKKILDKSREYDTLTPDLESFVSQLRFEQKLCF